MRRGEWAQTRANPWRLTVAELRLVRLVCEGLSTPKLCEVLCVTPKTLQSHLSRIYPKMGICDRAGLVLAVLHHPVARQVCFPELVIGDRVDRANGTDGLHRGRACRDAIR